MDIVLRASFAFFLIFLLTRVIGRRELSSMQPFDLILLIVSGDLVQQGVTQSDYSVTGMLLAVGTFAILAVVISYTSFKFRALRPVLDGEPIVLVENGRLIDGNLRRERITVQSSPPKPGCRTSPQSPTCAGRCSRPTARSAF